MENETKNTNEQTAKLSKKDLVGILQNHRSEILKDSQKKYEKALTRPDAYWNDIAYDAYQVDNVFGVSQLKISGYSQEREVMDNYSVKGKNIETAVHLYDKEDKQFKLVEYARGETPEKAYDNLIGRLQE